MTVRRFFWPALFVLLATLVGCDSSFDPYAETDQPFSLFGVLDASDQRHWVRVEPLQDDRPFTADSTIDATVTLTHLTSGQEVTLEDSRLSYRGGGVAHNFNGEMNLQLEERYRLAARRSDGQASTATLTMPHEIPALSLSGQGLHATVEGGTEDRLLFLNVTYRTIVTRTIDTPGGDREAPSSETYSFQYGMEASRTEAGYAASFDWEADVRSAFSGGPAEVVLVGIDAQVGLVHPSAPDYNGLSYEELFRPGAAPSNVENGYGHVTGITSDGASVTIPPNARPEIGIGG